MCNKIIPELRFPEFRNDWKINKIDDISICLDNKRKPINSQQRNFISGNIPYYGANGIQGYINNYIFDEELILLAEDGGHFEDFNTKPIAQYVSGKFWVNNHAHVLRAKENSKFLFYSLAHKDIRKYINGTSRGKLNKEDMLSILVNVPIPPEQQKIASLLTLIDNQIEKQSEKIINLENMKKGLMQKIFSQEIRFKDENGQNYPEWEEKKLGDVSSVTNGKGDVQDSNLQGKYPFFDRSDVLKFVDKYLYDNETIIYSGEGTNFYPRYFNGKYGLHQRCYSISNFALNIINPKFLYQSLFLYNNYFKKVAVGSTVPSLRINNFIDLRILTPSLKEQEKIIGILSNLDIQIQKEKILLEFQKQLKKGLLQQMFI